MAQIQPDVGIGISKDRLDIHLHPTGEAFSLAYDRAGLRALLRRPDLGCAVIGCEGEADRGRSAAGVSRRTAATRNACRSR